MGATTDSARRRSKTRAWRRPLAGAVVLGAVLAAAPAAQAATCSNDSIREQQRSGHLGDCRGYEQVSPADKLGYDVRRATGTIRSSLSGDAVTYNAFGPFAGPADGTGGTIPRYLSRRTETGWTTDSVNAPQGANHHYSGFIAFYFLHQSSDFSADLTRSALLNWELPLSPDLDQPIANRWNLFIRDHDSSTYELVNKVPGGPPPPEAVPFVGIQAVPAVEAVTPDLGHIVFQTPQNLTPDATGTFLKTYEWDHGEVRLVGVLPDESIAAAGASPGSGVLGAGTIAQYLAGDRDQSRTISADGSRIFFTALPLASNGRLYMRENGGKPNARTVWVSESEATTPGTVRPAQFRDATPDGSRVFFTTTEALLDEDTDAAVDLYRYDVTPDPDTGHHLTRISSDAEPADGSSATVQGVVGVSDDGERVYFVASGQLVPGAPTDAGPKLYLWDGGSIRYLHTFGPDRNSPASQNPNANNHKDSRNWSQVQADLKPSIVSADGRYLLFQTYTDVTGVPNESPNCLYTGSGDVGQCAQLYVFDSEAGAGEEFVCASCPADGSPPAGSAETKVNDGLLITGYDRNLPRRLVVVDGRVQVFFDTPTALVPGDVNGEIDVYAYDLESRRPTLISSGRDSRPSYLLDVSPSGRDVFFGTFARLVGSDKDELFDIYTARAGGGFEEPVVPRACSGDDCQGVPSQSRPTTRPGTTTFEGRGDASGDRPRALRLLPARSVSGRVAKLRLRVSQGGRLRITGRHVRSSSRSARPGRTVVVRVALRPSAVRALKQRSRLRVRVRVTFAPEVGRPAVRRATITFRARKGNR